MTVARSLWIYSDVDSYKLVPATSFVVMGLC